MKILLCVLIFCTSGLVGYLYKKRLQTNFDFLEYLLSYLNFLSSNITLFKNNVVEITKNFMQLENDKNKKYGQLFVTENGILKTDEKVLKSYISDEASLAVIKNFLVDIGKNDYEFEKEKIKNFELYLKSEREKAKQNFEKKGGLYFKLSLALGALICIIIW